MGKTRTHVGNGILHTLASKQRNSFKNPSVSVYGVFSSQPISIKMFTIIIIKLKKGFL